MNKTNNTRKNCCNGSDTHKTTSSTTRGFWLSLGSSGLALVSGIGCCGLPVMTSLLAACGVGSGFLTALRPFQPYLLAVAMVILSYELFKVYRPQPNKACCNRTGKRIVLTILFLVTITVFAIQLKTRYDAADRAKQQQALPNLQSPTKLEPAPCCH